MQIGSAVKGGIATRGAVTYSELPSALTNDHTSRRLTTKSNYAAALIVLHFVLSGCGGSVVPHFPAATLVFSGPGGRVLASCRLASMQVNQSAGDPIEIATNHCKLKHNGKSIEIKWRFIGTSSRGDLYDFEITSDQGPPMSKRIELTSAPIELLQDEQVVVKVESEREMTHSSTPGGTEKGTGPNGT